MINANYILYPFIILLGFLLERYEQRDKRIRIIYIATVLLVLLLQVALRGPSVGSDTPVYMDTFDHISNNSWAEIWTNFKLRYFYFIGTEDVGFFVANKFIYDFITTDFHTYCFLIGLTFFIPLGIIIYKFSKNIYYSMFALVMYTSLFHTIALSGGRQLYAMGFCMMAFLCVEKDQYKKAIIYILIGVLFHMTALLFYGYIAINYFRPRFGKRLHFYTFFGVPFVLMFTNTVILFMANISGNERYTFYGEGEIQGGVWTFIILIEFLSLFCFWTLNSKYIYDDHPEIGRIYNVLPFVTVLAPLIHSNGSMIRISMYYHLYLTILVPIACERFFGKKQIRQYLFYIILFLIFLTLSSTSGRYIFYWDDVEYWELEY